MNFSLVSVAALATAASAQYNYGQGYQQPQQYQGYQQYLYPTQNKYSPAEAAAWHSCIDGLLDQVNGGHEGTKVACSLWTCLEQQASKYNRGGALAGLGGVVNPVCKLSGFVPV